MIENLRRAADRVVQLQARYDAEDHRTTGANFMEEFGDFWEDERNAILGKIDQLRTEAIWSLGRLLDAKVA